MQLQHPKKNSLSLYVKFGALVFLLFLSMLIVACSGNGSVQLNQGTPVATVTIDLNQSGGSPTPPLKDYYCGGWATNTTPAFSPNTIVSVYGKFTHNVNGNPEGVPGATATAMVLWPDGSTDNFTVTTSSDGLAVFPIPLKPDTLNKEVLVQITFTAGPASCTVPLGATFFTPILASPGPGGTAVPSSTNTANPSATPTASPGSGIGPPTITPLLSPTPKH